MAFEAVGSAVAAAAVQQAVRLAPAVGRKVGDTLQAYFTPTPPPPPPPLNPPGTTCGTLLLVSTIAAIAATMIAFGVLGFREFAPFSVLGKIGSIALFSGGAALMAAEVITVAILVCKKKEPDVAPPSVEA